jgi:CDP-diacylglycerol--serine O-phosphatidyltransferase
MLVLVALFAFQKVVSEPLFSAAVYTTLLVLTALNLAPIHTPKFSDRWFYPLVGYALAMTAVFGWMLVAAR